MRHNAHSPSAPTHHNSSPDGDTERTVLGQHGQYAVTEIEILDGIIPSFDAYELIMRGHTTVFLGETETVTGSDDATVEPLALAFDSFNAVQDLGVELLRASHIVIPLEGITVFENVTDTDYDGTRWLENPANHRPPGFTNAVTYPKSPATPQTTSDTNNDDDDGAIPVQ